MGGATKNGGKKMDEQGADLNQSSGIFGEEKKSFWTKLNEGLRAFFGKVGETVAKIFVKKTDPETTETSFVGPMNKNIFTDEKEAGNLVRHEAELNEITPESGTDLGYNYFTARSRSIDEGGNSGVNREEAAGSTEENNENHALRTQPSERILETTPEIFYPETPEDLVWLLRKLPETVITKQQKRTMAAAMSFDAKRVREIMTPKDSVIFIHENDFMGPLTLSRLYQSGLSHFPVLGLRGEIVGIIHTKTLFSLSVKETDRASAFLDKNVYYMSENYTLKEALLAFIRTSCYFFIVVDGQGRTTGLLSFKKLISLIVGDLPETEFDQDQDLMSVVKHARELRENNIER